MEHTIEERRAREITYATEAYRRCEAEPAAGDCSCSCKPTGEGR